MADSNDDEDKVGELREAFEYNDRDGDGMIEIEEFVTMLDELEAGVSAAEARLGFQDIDSNDDGLIDFKEFTAWWTEG
jgi:calmodulin/calcium-binding protein CML/plastin-2